MKPLFVYLTCCWAVLLPESLSGQLPTVPPWAADVAPQLTPPDLIVYNKMNQAYEVLEAATLSRRGTEPIELSYAEREAIKQIVEARTAGTQAFVWMYLDDDKSNAFTYRYKLLRALYYDSEVAPALVKMVKSRLAWLATEMEQGRVETKTVDEMGSIAAYLQYQGRFEDIEPIVRITKLFPHPHQLAATFRNMTSERQKGAFAELRAEAIVRSRPYWRDWADALIIRGYETESSLGLNSSDVAYPIPAPTPIPAAVQTEKPAAKKPPDISMQTILNEDSDSPTSWILVGVLFVAVTGSLWLLFKNCK